MNKKYWLEGDNVQSREATAEELAAARTAAKAKMAADPGSWAMRSCWECNGSHTYFLADTDDGFLFTCLMGCGRWYYNGVDITEDSDEDTDDRTPAGE